MILSRSKLPMAFCAAQSQNRSLPPVQAIHMFCPRIAAWRTASGARPVTLATSMISFGWAEPGARRRQQTLVHGDEIGIAGSSEAVGGAAGAQRLVRHPAELVRGGLDQAADRDEGEEAGNDRECEYTRDQPEQDAAKPSLQHR